MRSHKQLHAQSSNAAAADCHHRIGCVQECLWSDGDPLHLIAVHARCIALYCNPCVLECAALQFVLLQSVCAVLCCYLYCECICVLYHSVLHCSSVEYLDMQSAQRSQ